MSDKTKFKFEYEGTGTGFLTSCERGISGGTYRLVGYGLELEIPRDSLRGELIGLGAFNSDSRIKIKGPVYDETRKAMEERD
jgi:hypothetical protein